MKGNPSNPELSGSIVAANQLLKELIGHDQSDIDFDDLQHDLFEDVERIDDQLEIYQGQEQIEAETILPIHSQTDQLGQEPSRTTSKLIDESEVFDGAETFADDSIEDNTTVNESEMEVTSSASRQRKSLF